MDEQPPWTSGCHGRAATMDERPPLCEQAYSNICPFPKPRVWPLSPIAVPAAPATHPGRNTKTLANQEPRFSAGCTELASQSGPRPTTRLFATGRQGVTGTRLRNEAAHQNRGNSGGIQEVIQGIGGIQLGAVILQCV